MILIEFLDAAPIKNIGGAFVDDVEKIVYIGSVSNKKGNEVLDNIREYLRKKGIKTQVSYLRTARHDVDSAIRTIERVLNSVPRGTKCCIDTVGGNETMLIAAGAVMQKRRSRGLPLDIISVCTEKGCVHCRNGEGAELADECKCSNTVEENAILHGGAVLKAGGIRPVLSQNVCNMIDKVWETAMRGKGVGKSDKRRSFPKRWNSFLGCVYAAGLKSNGIDFSISNARKKLGAAEYDEVIIWLEALEKCGAISLFVSENGDYISFTCRDGADKLLRKAGNLLEMKVYAEASLCGLYCDSATGVSLDWDGRVGDTENEIDVMLMKGLCPIFISCKNGKIDDEELYKLETVSRRFGGRYARKVVFVSDYGGLSNLAVSSLKRRAENMGIRIIDNVHLVGNAELKRLVRSLGERAHAIE